MRQGAGFSSRILRADGPDRMILAANPLVRVLFGAAALAFGAALVLGSEFPADWRGGRLPGTLLVLACTVGAAGKALFDRRFVLDKADGRLTDILTLAGIPLAVRDRGALADLSEVALWVVPLGARRPAPGAAGGGLPKRALYRLFLHGEGGGLFLEESGRPDGPTERGTRLAAFLGVPFREVRD